MSATPRHVMASVKTPGWSERFRKLFASLLVGEGLKGKVFRGGAWLGTGSFSEQVIRFGRNMVLARILAPEAFGTMAIVLSASSVVQTIMDVGVREALIQNSRGSDDEYVGAAWWMAFGRALSFWAVLSTAAPIIAKFYGNPQLTALFRVSAVWVLLDGSLSTRAFSAIREMRFRSWALINHGGAILGIVATIVLSFMLHNIWALVLGSGCESLGRFALSYIVCPFFPPFRLPLAAIRDLLKFSKRAFGLSLLNLIFSRTDIFVLAKMFSARELGLYTMAVFLAQTPCGFILNLLGQTLLPTFSQMQNDKTRTNRVLMRVTSVLLVVGTPVLIFVCLCGHWLLGLFYGAKYAGVGAPLRVAALVTVINILNGQITTIFYAVGRPQLHRRCVLISSMMMILSIYPAVWRFGLVGGQLAALLAIMAGFFFQVIRMRSITGFDTFAYAKTVAIFAGISLIAFSLFFGARSVVSFDRPVPNLLIGVGACLMAGGLGLLAYLKGEAKFAT